LLVATSVFGPGALGVLAVDQKKMAEINPEILRFDSLPSTNLEAARRAIEGATEGLCVVASEQTAGRGRLQRQWISPRGAGLYFSIILRPLFEQSVWPLLTLMAAIAVHDTLLDVCGFETDIKWPNDVLVNEKKLCGILAETVETPAGRAVVVGIGINLTAKSVSPELYRIATSVEAATGKSPDVEIIIEALVHVLITQYGMLQDPDGPRVIVGEWCARSSYAEGKRISVTEGNQTFVGTTRGLERDGALRVKTDDGEMRIVRAGDVSVVRPA
jgi:BirA family biotin operon repressor/biotin-[acetyl-CoA-carboxylase] ligase